MSIYRLELINPDAGLNLEAKKDAISAVMNYILDGGRDKTSFREVLAIKIKDILPRSIIIDVQENGCKWHAAVGQRLANDYGMRHFCNQDNSYQMFRWTIVE